MTSSPDVVVRVRGPRKQAREVLRHIGAAHLITIDSQCRLSSREGCRRRELVGSSIAQEGPEDVDAAAGEGEDGLGVAFVLGSFALVEPAGLRTFGC